MTAYHVRFIKDLCDSTGHTHKCVQGVVDIGRARDSERAVQAAKRRFERMKGITRWDLYADTVELVIDERMPNLPRARFLIGPGRHANHVEGRRLSATNRTS